jgi:hypothetical protein
MKRRVNSRSKLHCCLILRNCNSQLSNLQQPSPWSVSNHQHQGNTLRQQKDYSSPKIQLLISIFSNKVFLLKVNTFLNIMHYKLLRFESKNASLVSCVNGLVARWWAFERWLDHNGAYFISDLFHWWIHSWMDY